MDKKCLKKAIEDNWDSFRQWLGWTGIELSVHNVLEYLGRGEDGLAELREICKKQTIEACQKFNDERGDFEKMLALYPEGSIGYERLVLIMAVLDMKISLLQSLWGEEA